MRLHLAAPFLLALTFHATPATAALVTKPIDYKAGDVAMQGFLVYDGAQPGPRPGVVVFPEWWGLNDRMKGVGTEMAKLGYVAFVADMYGGGKITTDATEAGKLAGEVYGKPAMRQRAIAALPPPVAAPVPVRVEAVSWQHRVTVERYQLVAREGFVDRAYEADGTLRSRRLAGSLHTDPKVAAAQAVSFVKDGGVRAYDGSFLRLEVDTLCLHGDTPGAPAIAAAVREAFAREGIEVHAPA